MSWLRTIVTGALTLMLTFAFLMAGSVKLTDRFETETHKKMVEGAREYPGIFHLPLSADTMRIAIGAAEVSCAILVLFGGKIAAFACWILMSIMCGAVYFHIMTSTPFVVPAILGAMSFFLCLLSLRPTASSASAGKSKGKKAH